MSASLAACWKEPATACLTVINSFIEETPMRYVTTSARAGRTQRRHRHSDMRPGRRSTIRRSMLSVGIGALVTASAATILAAAPAQAAFTPTPTIEDGVLI